MDERPILIDGFPRDPEQTRGFLMEKCLRSPLGFQKDFISKTLQIKNNGFFISFICPKLTTKQRYLIRKPPGRLDDDDEAKFWDRFARHESDFSGVMDLYECLVEEVKP